MEGDTLPPDWENWKQCPSCYAVIPIYEVRTEGILFSDLRTDKITF